jgi:hypothetical protein
MSISQILSQSLWSIPTSRYDGFCFRSVITQHHRGPELYTHDSLGSPFRDHLSQLTRLDHPNTNLPRGGLVIIHGVDDDVVLTEVSKRFVDKARVILK